MRRRRFRTWVSWALACALTAMTPGGPAPLIALAQSEAPGGPSERLDAVLAGYEAALERLDATTVDVDELAFEVAFEEPDAIVRRVTEDIAYHPYVGLLRGPTGTLLARAGNSLDQAVFLAKLLNDAGFEARIARASLDDDQQGELWRRAAIASQPDAAAGDVARALTEQLGISETAIAAVGAAVTERIERMRGAFSREVEALEQVLLERAAWPAEADVSAIPHEEEYAWVQYRATPSADWTPAHPVFRDPPAWIETLVPEETIEDAVPDALQHRLRFRVVIEQRQGDDLVERPLMEALERPIANLVGVSMSFTNLPDALSDLSAASSDLAEAVRSSNFLYPIVNDALAPGGQAFDLMGNTVPPDAAAAPAAGVFQSMGEAVGDAIGALDGEEEAIALTAQWLEFTLIEPGGAEVVHRRATFDRIGATNRRAGRVELSDEVTEDDVVRAIQATHTFMVDPGAYSPQYLEYSVASTILDHQGYLRDLFTASPGASPMELVPPAALTSEMRDVDHLRQFLAFDAFQPDDAVLSYRHAPMLTILTRSWDGARAMTDVVQNERTSLRLSASGSPELAPRHSLAMGVWESVAESVILPAGGERFDVPQYMAEARAQGVPLQVIPPDAVGDVDLLDVPDESRQAMLRDLADGYVVVAPTRRPEGMERAAWWRVDEQTGVALGRGLDGRGVGTATEYVTTTGLIISTLFGVAGAMSCMGSGGSGTCCLSEGIGWFAVGFAIGGAAGLIAGALMAGTGAAGVIGIEAAHIGLTIGVGFDIASATLGIAGILPTACSPDGRTPGADPHLASVAPEGGTCDLGPLIQAMAREMLAARGRGGTRGAPA